MRSATLGSTIFFGLAALAGTVMNGSAASAAAVQFAGNGHYYEVIAGQEDWNQAFSDAQALTNFGQHGYLATITSQAENDFVASLITTAGFSAWLGGSDAAAEGVWKWADGPEAGHLLSYTNWAGGEPNNANGDEDSLMMYAGSGLWNDLLHSYPGFQNGYVVEFNGAQTPLPPAILLFASALGGLGLVGWRRRSA